MIKVENISKSFGKKEVLKNISFTIKKGECLGLLGSNGSGKTTLLEIITGQIKPSSGQIFMEKIKKDGKYNVGIQFQEGLWPKGVTSAQIISYFKKQNFVLKNLEVQKLIEIFEIKDFVNKDLNNLSGGQKQRLNTLLAVINDPDNIFLDEMITGLDLKMQLKLVKYFSEIKSKNKTMIIISHIPEEVEQMCDRVIILKDGEVFYDNYVKQIIKEYGTVRKLMVDYYEEKLKSNTK